MKPGIGLQSLAKRSLTLRQHLSRRRKGGKSSEEETSMASAVVEGLEIGGDAIPGPLGLVQAMGWET